ncbi:Rep protein [Bacillus cereus]|uniref:rolling circle replication-associated protein n=1 Tax=Bacillus cereus TaxID=1396 RepID=UPI0011A7A40E|nr:Rep protein [Bacillus cereus]MDM5370089.1 Rep protein [Bacillus bombysepticus]MBT0793346.1 Rep protein [Bacillus cereus]MDA2650683.1 Rep protein [Bacillus cereus]MDZ4545224.1 Rep protein [Bacillus cereus]MDZ4604358.1 Rep protein [Bacillus cereus]
MATLYDAKVYISGNVIEIYKYSDTRACGYSIPNKAPTGGGDKVHIDFETGEIIENGIEVQKLESRMQSNIRARNEVRRIVLSNFDNKSKFMTLTFRENLQDIEKANKCFTDFVRALNRDLSKKGIPKMKYIAVVEFQKRGAIHYHMICDLKGFRAKRLWELWKNATRQYDGGVDIKNIKQVDNLGAYVTKYMVKDLEKVDERLIGKKAYQRSLNLDKPKQLVLNFRKEKDRTLFEELTKDKKITYQSKYDDKHTGGSVDYIEINLSRQK